MAQAKPMLQFLGQLNKTKGERLTEINLRVDSIVKNLKTQPKPNYSINDIANYLEETKKSMQDVMTRTFEGFSKAILPVLRGGSLGDTINDESLEDLLGTKQFTTEITNLKAENERLKVEISNLRSTSGGVPAPSINAQQLLEVRQQLNQKDIEIQNKDFEIQKIKNELDHTLETVQNYQYKINQSEAKLNEYGSRIAKLQIDYDAIIREKASLQNQVQALTNESRSYRTKIDDLEISLTRKEREKTEMQKQIEEFNELEEENTRLRGAVLEAAEKIKKASTDIRDVEDQARRETSKKDEEIRNLTSVVEKLREEKELFIIDSQEMSKTVDYYRTEFEKSSNELQSKHTELEAMETQLNMLMTSGIGTSSQPLPTNPLSMLDSIEAINAQDSRIEEIKNQLNIVTEERNKALDEAKKFSVEVGRLTSEIGELNRNIKRLDTDKANLQREVEAIKQELDLELELRKKGQEQANKYRLDRAELEQKYQELLHEHDNLRSSIETMKREYERKLKNTDDLDNRIHDLRSERDTLENQLADRDQQYKAQVKNNHDLEVKFQALEQELADAQQKMAEEQKKFVQESKEKAELARKVETLTKDFSDATFKLQQQMQTTSAEELERNKLLETISEYRLKETDLNTRVTQLEGKLTDQIAKIDSLLQENDLKDKQIEVHLNRQKQLNDVVTKLRLENEDLGKYKDEIDNLTTVKDAEIESLTRNISKLQKDLTSSEVQIKNCHSELAESTEKTIKLTNEIQEKETTLENVRLSTTQEIETIQKKLTREKQLSEFYKRSLEDYPKHMILFILNEVRRATIKELERTTRRSAGAVKLIIKELEGEGYIKISADEETVEMVKSYPPI